MKNNSLIRKNHLNIQNEHWNSTKYRKPDHRVIEAYITPKLKFINNFVRFQDKTILDVGCGNGLITYYLKKDYGCNPIGIDINSYLLSQNIYSSVIKGDSLYLPFHDCEFECVIEANLLHHVVNPLHVVAEMKRVSKRYIIIIEPNIFNPLMFMFSLLVKAERGGFKSSITNLEKYSKDNGLKIIGKMTTGMISQNNTPEFLLPILKHFDFNFFFGEYNILICEKMYIPG